MCEREKGKRQPERGSTAWCYIVGESDQDAGSAIQLWLLRQFCLLAGVRPQKAPLSSDPDELCGVVLAVQAAANIEILLSSSSMTATGTPKTWPGR